MRTCPWAATACCCIGQTLRTPLSVVGMDGESSVSKELKQANSTTTCCSNEVQPRLTTSDALLFLNSDAVQLPVLRLVREHGHERKAALRYGA